MFRPARTADVPMSESGRVSQAGAPAAKTALACRREIWHSFDGVNTTIVAEPDRSRATKHGTRSLFFIARHSLGGPQARLSGRFCQTVNLEASGPRIGGRNKFGRSPVATC
jgi:hypothetical protein